MSTQEKTDFSAREYEINGKKCFQTALSPFQMVRLLTAMEAIKKIMIEAGLPIPDVKNIAEQKGNKVDIDLTFALEVIEKNPEVVADLLNVILKNPATGKPGYVDKYFKAEDVEAIDAPTMLEVVADFFILTDIFKLYLSYLKISNRMGMAKAMFLKH